MDVIFFNLHVNNLAENFSLKTKKFPSKPKIPTPRSTFQPRFYIQPHHNKHIFITWNIFQEKEKV
jgi:hypothetical protein